MPDLVPGFVNAQRQRETEAFYRTLTTANLRAMQRAFEADRVAGKDDPVTVAFCQGRLAVLAKILAGRDDAG